MKQEPAESTWVLLRSGDVGILPLSGRVAGER